MRLGFVIALLLALSSPFLAGAAKRTWTDVQGRTLEGKFVRQNAESVWILRSNGRRVKIDKEDLSEGDRAYLEELANLPGQGERFDTDTIDPEAWKLQPGGFVFDGLDFPRALVTKHFVVAGQTNVRENILSAYAEAAERLLVDMTSDLPLMEDTFKDRRMLIVLADEEEQASAFAEWHSEHANRVGVSTSSYSLTRYTIVAFQLGQELAAKHKLLRSGRLFRLDAKSAQNTRNEWPQRIHFLTSEYLTNALRPVRDNGDYTLSMLRLSYAYHREAVICGGIKTEVTYGGGEDIEGFRNGRNWAGATRRILSHGRRPSIESYLQKEGSDANPRNLGFGHGLMCFIHHDPRRLAGFGKLMENAVKNEKCPDAAAFAKALGYDSPTALDTAWLVFMESDDFE